VYLPKNKFRIKYTNGGELFNTDGSEYVGPYIQTSEGRLNKGNSLTNAGDRIYALDDLIQSIEVDTPFNDYEGPTKQDYERGFFTRYILQNIQSKVIKEVNRERFIKFSKIEDYISEEFIWYLSKPFDNEVKNGYLIEGSKTKNQRTIDDLNKRIFQITDFVSSDDYLI